MGQSMNLKWGCVLVNENGIMKTWWCVNKDQVVGSELVEIKDGNVPTMRGELAEEKNSLDNQVMIDIEQESCCLAITVYWAISL